MLWGALPRGGGTLDQPAGMLERMRQTLEVWRAFRAWKGRDKLKQAEWKRKNPEAWALVKRVQELREEVKRG